MSKSVLHVALPLLLLLGLQQLGSGALIHAKAWLAPLLVERAWSQSQAIGGEPVKPWPWADTWPVARLRVPSLAVSQLVLAGDTGNALAFGPGYKLASAAPGAGGSTVIGGHRDTHFRFLRNLRPGQRLVLELPSQDSRFYKVKEIQIVDTSEEPSMAIEGDERLILVTCYPFDALTQGGPLRYLVIADPEPVALPVFGAGVLGSERFSL